MQQVFIPHPVRKAFFLVTAMICLWPAVSAGMALMMGIAFALFIGNPFSDMTKKHTSTLLSWSVIGLGAGMNLGLVIAAGVKGIGYTVISLVLCIGIGLALGRMLKTDKESSWLITIGTAICGGSAIAAVAPVMRASSHHISAAMGVVFCLNALALLVFPPIGHMMGLNSVQFGYWAALAIHDTSSVVGAGLKYGSDALQTATTVKLARALWIVPLTLALPFFYHAPKNTDASVPNAKPKRPWFILGFLAMAALFTYTPSLASLGQSVSTIARQLLVLTLFLIGTNLSLTTLRQVGIKPLLQGILLWIIAATLSLAAIKFGWIV